jgi:PilZ domain-containing protein
VLPAKVLIPFCSESDKGTHIPRATEEERRKHVRYEVRVPVFFSWKRRGGAVFRSEGITRDISLRGAYVLSAICPPVDTFIEMEILLPRPLPAPNLLIVGKVRIQRVESSLTKKRDRGFSAVGSGFVVRTSLRCRPAIVRPEAPNKKGLRRISMIERFACGSLEILNPGATF